MCHLVLSSVACLVVPYFSTLSKGGVTRESKLSRVLSRASSDV